MITRDNAASVTGTAQNARQRLGEVIKFHRTAREITIREVSRRARCSIADVESWESGAIVPSGEQWKALTQGINRSLNAYNELRLRAQAEQDAERATIARSIGVHATNGHNRKIGTNLGDKLVTARPGAEAPAAHTPPPAIISSKLAAADSPSAAVRQSIPVAPQLHPEETQSRKGRTMPDRPVGSLTDEAVQQRKDFARGLLMQYPRKRTSGADSVVEAVRIRFGIGIAPETVDEIRAELQRDKLKAEIASEMRAAGASPQAERFALATAGEMIGPQATIDLINAEQAQRDLTAKIERDASIAREAARLERARGVPASSAATDEINAADLEAAVQLVLGAVPGLQTFTIAVDEHGEASVEYQVRKVVVTTAGGSIKVRRG